MLFRSPAAPVAEETAAPEAQVAPQAPVVEETPAPAEAVAQTPAAEDSAE